MGALGGTLCTVRSADGTTIGFERLGYGPPLVAVHGSTADRTRWLPVAALLAEDYDVAFVDRRGRGDSTVESEPYAIEREAEDILAVCEAMGGSTLIVAHSYGAASTVVAAPRLPGLVRRAVLYEPALPTPGFEVIPEQTLDQMRQLLGQGEREAALITFYREVLAVPEEAIEPMRSLPMWQVRIAAVHTIIREGEAANGLRVEETEWPQSVPVRILLGEATAPWLDQAARTLHAHISGSELFTLPGQGHLAIDQAPALFVEAVRSFDT